MTRCFSRVFCELKAYQRPLTQHLRASHVPFNLTTAKPSKKRTMATHDSPVEITAEPKVGQGIEYEGKVYTTLREGRAYILVPPNARTSVDPKAESKADDGSQTQNVFYNPIQQFNRDLSVLAIKAFGEDMCQRKREKHEARSEKNKSKNERKRKRDAAKSEGQGDEDCGVKLQKSEDGSPVAAAHTSSGPASSGLNGGANGTEDAPAPHVGENANGTSTEQPAQKTEKTRTSTGDAETESTMGEGKINTQQQWQPRFRILDALSATGLRALRYAGEIPFATKVVANDRERAAVKSINVNVEHNKLSSAITATTGDAIGHMYAVAYPPPDSHGPNHISGKYDVIDLDPYGTAAPFIDAALQALEDGGLLCVTCTDSGVFASCGYSEKTFSLYGGMPTKGLHSHEGGLRVIIQSIATTASKYGLAIEPLLSLSIDFYARLFIRVRKSPQDVKFLAGKSMIVYNCDHGCGAWTTQFLGRHTKHKNSDTNYKYGIAQAPAADQTCEHCGSKTHVAGPMWGGPLHNPAFIEKILEDVEKVDGEIYQTKPRIEGMLDTALEELIVNDVDETQGATTTSSKELIPKLPPQTLDHHPFYFVPSALCKVIKAQAPAESLLKGALRHAGYRTTRSHCKAGSIKTDAPWGVIWEVMREWVRQRSPVKEGALQEGQAGWRILKGMRKEDASEGEGTPDIVVTESEKPSTALLQERARDPEQIKVVFDEKLGKDKPGKRLVRFQENPKENWGPMRRAKGSG